MAERTMEPLPEAPSGRVVSGRYRLVERVGEGTTGVVWKAQHLAFDKTFALKILHPEIAADATSRARFEREATTLGRLQHPNVVSITDFGFDESAEGAPFLVMEYVEGISLDEYCRQEGPLPLHRALPILRTVAGAIDAAHDAGILHRDLKPQNIVLCSREGEPPTARVLDFGLAASLESRPDEGRRTTATPSPDEPRLTDVGALLGTPLYIAPELIRQPQASPASDIYALAVVAYEMLVGAPPFVGTTAEILRGHLEADPPRPQARGVAVPEGVWDVLHAALSKDPSRRPPRAGEFVRSIEEALEREQQREHERVVRRRSLWLSAAVTGASALLTLSPPLAPLLQKVERATRDWRLRHASPRAPDPRLVLVTLDDASPLGVPSPPVSGGSGGPLAGSLADAGDVVGAGLARILSAGAKGVALDLVLPPKWAESRLFSDVVVRHPDRIVLGAQATADGTIIGTECVAGFTTVALGADRTAALFGLVNVTEDDDGLTRRARLVFTDAQGQPRPFFAAAAARLLAPASPDDAGNFRIDYRVDWRRFNRIRWADVSRAAERDPAVFRDRLVLVGADFLASGEDAHRAPVRGENGGISGLTLQALIAHTILEGRPLRAPSSAPFLAAFLLLTVVVTRSLVAEGRTLVTIAMPVAVAQSMQSDDPGL